MDVIEAKQSVAMCGAKMLDHMEMIQDYAAQSIRFEIENPDMTHQIALRKQALNDLVIATVDLWELYSAKAVVILYAGLEAGEDISFGAVRIYLECLN